jgi:rhodanese-related sulfurtransferase
LNKRYLSYFAAVLLAFLIIAPGIAAAEDNVAGYTIVDASTAKQMLKNGEVCLLDVRTENEFNAAHLKRANLVPVKKELGPTVPFVPEEEFLKEVENSGITKGSPVLVYCLSGSRSMKASEYLANNGYTVYNMEVGIQGWIDARYSVVSTFVDVSGVDDCIKQVLNSRINCVFFFLKMCDDDEANEQLDRFNHFVNKIEQINRIDADQAAYLTAEAELIRKMI